jgi:hypothetical protein
MRRERCVEEHDAKDESTAGTQIAPTWSGRQWPGSAVVRSGDNPRAAVLWCPT